MKWYQMVKDINGMIKRGGWDDWCCICAKNRVEAKKNYDKAFLQWRKNEDNIFKKLRRNKNDKRKKINKRTRR